VFGGRTDRTVDSPRRLRVAVLLLTSSLLVACAQRYGTVPIPGAVTASAGTLVLSPEPLELSSDTPADDFTVQNDTPGSNYTPSADPSCQTASGGIAVAGDGQAQTDVASAPLMFLVYAFGTPPATCAITLTGPSGQFGAIDVTDEVAAVSSVHRATRSVSPGVLPGTLSFTASNQVMSLTATGFTGTATATATCPAGQGGISVNPKTIAGTGTIVVAPYGQGSVQKTCTVTIADTTGSHVAIPVSLAIGALARFSVAPSVAQFGCVGFTLPKHCQTNQPVVLSEAGTPSFTIADGPKVKQSCAIVFDGAMRMLTGDGTVAAREAGPTASVTFDGLLPTQGLDCNKIVLTDGGTPSQRVTIAISSVLGAPPPTLTAATAPSCSHTDSRVAVPTAPHGMFVWNPYIVSNTASVKGAYEAAMESTVIGNDKTLCGVSLVIPWADIEPQKVTAANGGTYNWGFIVQEARPYTAHGLTVNLLFEDGPERGANNPITPSWVTAANGDNVPIVQCTNTNSAPPVEPPAPDYLSPVFEADWEAFMAAAVYEFSGAGQADAPASSPPFAQSTIAPHIGYMRFAIGFGVEAEAGHLDEGDCMTQWKTLAGYSYAKWVQHERNIVNAMGSLRTDKQLMIALNSILPAPASIYQPSDEISFLAASYHIGFGTENLGIAGVATPKSVPAACDPTSEAKPDLYWCQAFTRHLGEVPFEFQPINPSTSLTSDGSVLDITNLLLYALDNNTQILEMYPQEWMAADVPSSDVFVKSKQAKYQAALSATSLVLGAAP
jgi:hypothetical protein